MPQNLPGRRGPWTNQEDNRLRSLIGSNPTPNWVEIAQGLAGRTPKQCRERYHQNLKPGLEQKPITEEEGEFINRMVEMKGRRWAEIARMMRGRSDNSIKNWWNGSQNRKQRLRDKRSHDNATSTHAADNRSRSQSLNDVSQHLGRWSQSHVQLNHPPNPFQQQFHDYPVVTPSTALSHGQHRLPPSPDLPQQPRSRYHAGGIIEEPLPSPASSQDRSEFDLPVSFGQSPSTRAHSLVNPLSTSSNHQITPELQRDSGYHRLLESRILPPLPLRYDANSSPTTLHKFGIAHAASCTSLLPLSPQLSVPKANIRALYSSDVQSNTDDPSRRGREIMNLSSLLR